MLKCIWPRKGQGRLTKEMREKMKREVDLYDESCNFALDGGSQEPDTPQTPYRLRRSGSQPFVNFAIDHTTNTLVLHSSDLPINDPSSIFTSSSSEEEEDSPEAEDFHSDLNRYRHNKSRSASQSSLRRRKKSLEFNEQHDCEGELPTGLIGDPVPPDITRQPSREEQQEELTTGFIDEQLPPEVARPPSQEEWLTLFNSPQNVPGTPPTEAFWEKLFDLNFTEPIMSPNFSIISTTLATPAIDDSNVHKLRATAAITGSTTDEDDYAAYGLDEEQSEKFYEKLMDKFIRWTAVTNQAQRASVDKLISQYMFSEQDLLLYYTCIHYFLPAVGPQQTLPQLTTTETFVPLLTKHPIVKNVFLCCGATFLAWCQPLKYSEIAESLYQSSKSRLQEELTSKRIRGDETWAFACFQLLCLTDKFHNGKGESMVDRCVDNLAHSFNIIKRKYHDIKEHGSTPTDRMLIES